MITNSGSRSCRRYRQAHLVHAGVPIPIVSERLGHANPATTMRIYAHVIPDSQDVAVEVMSRLLFGN